MTKCGHKTNIYYTNTSFEKKIKFYKDIDELNKNNDCVNFKKGDRYSFWNVFLRTF